MKLPGSTEHYDIYLGKTLYPVLLPAVEALSKEYDRQQFEYSKFPFQFLFAQNQLTSQFANDSTRASSSPST